MKYKRSIITLGVVLVVVAAVLLIRGTATKPVPTSAMSTDVPVSIIVAQKQRLASSVSLAGTINPSNDVNVISETQGSVRRSISRWGTLCRQGQYSWK
jgi:multidrug efflux pump subunit AcrA (membrane-fusion protein)